MLSYAQRLEDTHLARVFHDVEAGTYIDVGGGHPIADNVTFHFYLAGWRGLVVEPQEKLAETHRRVRPRDTVYCGLVGRTDGTATFHTVDRLHGFSTTLAEHARTAAAFGTSFASATRPMKRLASLTAEHGLRAVDLLKIDVEGAEADVLAGADWTACRPRVLVIEAVAPGSMAPAWEGWDPFVVAQGYSFAFFDGLNRFYVAREHDGLASRFPAEPLAWESVGHLWDCGRAPDNPKHPDHALACRLVAGFLAHLPTLDPRLVRDILMSGEPGLPADDAELVRLLSGTSDPLEPAPLPVAPGSRPALIEALLATDRVRGALGRIACTYDGGHLMED